MMMTMMMMMMSDESRDGSIGTRFIVASSAQYRR